MFVAYPLKLKQVPRSLIILSYLHNFCRSSGEKVPKIWPKMCLFFKLPEKLLIGRVSTVQKFFNDHIFYTPIGTQLRACSLKISNHSDHI